MTTRYSTALSHLVLAGTSIYCYIGAAKKIGHSYPRCCFGILIANSLIGVWRWGKYILTCNLSCIDFSIEYLHIKELTLNNKILIVCCKFIIFLLKTVGALKISNMC